ncbi:MAG: 50S ribosomal protein L11 methyltransferase [Clostridiales Family XIII bacterium]|nr:50S ribosomal protein L11 methyltransferase [Clostridiales Family XIII bacterium]
MNYKENKIVTTSMGTEAVQALLLMHGVDTVTIEDRADIQRILSGKDDLDWDYIDPSLFFEGLTGEISKADAKEKVAETDFYSGEATLTFYTEDTEEGAALIHAVHGALKALKADISEGRFGADADFGSLHMTTSEITDEWKHKWKENFKPFCITDRFAVSPPWEEAAFDGSIEVIVIDPGMAFGTGSHETTAMCVSALQQKTKKGAYVLDIGAGSGILSIVAAKMGASRVTSVEIDADAAASMSKNFIQNKVTDTVDVVVGDICDEEAMQKAGIPPDNRLYDVIVANLTSGLLIFLLPSMVRLLSPGGVLILSGLLDIESPKMVEVLETLAFENIHKEIRGEWLLLCADFLPTPRT